MLNNRLIVILAAAALLVVAFSIVETGTATSPAVPNGAVSSDTLQRYPNRDISLAGAEPLDYYQRHPGSAGSIVAVASDWFERHPGVLNAANVVNLLDYFQRHPTTLKLGNVSGATDYFQRHPNSLKPSNAVDLADWYQRHEDRTTF